MTLRGDEGLYPTEQTYPCTVCGRLFHGRPGLRSHMVTWHSGQSASTTTTTTLPVASNDEPSCSHSFTNIDTHTDSDFTAHVSCPPNDHHVLNGPFTCLQCNRSFQLMRGLRCHQTRKHRMTEVSNGQQSDIFGTIRAFRCHAKKMHGVNVPVEDPASCQEPTSRCNICSRQFRDERSLHIHMTRMHTSHDQETSESRARIPVASLPCVINATSVSPLDLGRMTARCFFCHAHHFPGEATSHGSALDKKEGRSFSHCCLYGKVKFLTSRATLPIPHRIRELHMGSSPDCQDFRRNLRLLNNHLALASFQADKLEFMTGQAGRGAPSTIRIQGQIYSLVSRTLQPRGSEQPAFCQLYFVEPSKAISSRHDYLRENHLSLFESTNVPHLISELDSLLRQVNQYARLFQTVRERTAAELEAGKSVPDLSVAFLNDPQKDSRVYRSDTCDHLAVVYTESHGQEPQSIDFEVFPRNSNVEHNLRRVSYRSSHADPMVYPLLFPHGEQGWEPRLLFGGIRQTSRQGMSMREFYQYRLAYRPETYDDGSELSLIHHSRLLSQQFFCDAFLRIELNNLQWFKNNQQQIRAETYAGLSDYLMVSQGSAEIPGSRRILPASFEGGPRNVAQRYQDAISMVREYGKPDYFITFTCNPSWAEIQECLGNSQLCAADRPDLAVRVFFMKRDELIKDLAERNVFGQAAAYVHVIEYQKRGLPHAHILLIVESEYKLRTADDVDLVISAEIPDDKESDPLLFDLVTKHMIHGPCGAENLSQPCMKDGTCSKKFPKEERETTLFDGQKGYPLYRRRKIPPFDVKSYNKTSKIDNRFVVPYSPYLLKKYNAHINVEVCSTLNCLKYMYKYMFNRHDMASMTVGNDEIQHYIDGRYVSPCEAYARICSFPHHGQSHSVKRLPVHLENMQTVIISATDDDQQLRKRLEESDKNGTMLTAYFKLNADANRVSATGLPITGVDPRTLLYHEVPQYFSFGKGCWVLRQRKPSRQVVRVNTVSPREDERFHLRLLLLHVPGSTSFQQLKTVNGEEYPSYHEAARAHGLLAGDEVWMDTLREATSFKMPHQLRSVFAIICIYSQPSNCLAIFNEYRSDLSEDCVQQRNSLGELITQTDNAAVDICLWRLESIFNENGTSITQYGLPLPQELSVATNRNYNPRLEAILASEMRGKLNCDQLSIYDDVIHAVRNHDPMKGNMFFIDAPGGTGKTFLIEALMHDLRGKGQSVVPVAYSGIAAILLQGGRTAHSTCGIPLHVHETSTSTIKPSDKRGRLLRDCDLFVFDEAPMASKLHLKVIDEVFRLVTQNEEVPFGGKVVLMSGDFRQVLPVVPYGCPADVVQSSLKRSNLWSQIDKRFLTANMRAQNDPSFASFLLDLGGGDPPLTTHNQVVIDTRFLCEGRLEEFTFQGINLDDPSSYTQCVILTPKNEDCHRLNDLIVNTFFASREEVVYKSVDQVLDDHDEVVQDEFAFPIEFVNSLTPQGMPPHVLKIRRGAVVVVLRNLDPDSGLCNGTRLVITDLRPHVLKGTILTGPKRGETVMIPRIKMKTEEKMPFKLGRQQFPVRLAFAMTINKAQGQTFDRVGLLLPAPVFAHGQLYVAFSRVRQAGDIRVKMMEDTVQGMRTEGGIVTSNVVCKAVLR